MSANMPENEAPEWVSYINVLIPNSENNAILMLPDGNKWGLPFVRVDGGIWLAATSKITAVIREQLGLSFAFTILRLVHAAVNQQKHWDQFTYVLELHEPLIDPPLGGQWANQRMLLDLTLAQPDPLAQPELGTVLAGYLHESQSNTIPQQRAPWARPGWFNSAAAWIEATLATEGIKQTGPVEQLRTWSISTILRAPSSHGWLYFKAVADLPLFVNEASMVVTLAQLFPANTPMPVRIDSTRRWLLMEDFGPSLQQQGVVDLAPAVAAYGQFQRATISHLDALRAAHCIDRRLQVLAGQIDPLLADPITKATISEPDLAELVALAPRFKAACVELAKYEIPGTLVHGDLHLGNIAMRNGNYLFFDWTDACISHPFLDMLVIYYYQSDDAEQIRLRESYLAGWTEYADPERLRRAWELAKPLCALHQAVSYLHIVKHTELLVREELVGGIPSFLQRLLASSR